jgi:hypothetical protein
MRATGKELSTKPLRHALFAAVTLCVSACSIDARADCLLGKQNISGKWIEYELQNSCNFRIKFNVDYCYPQDYSIENSLPDCEIRILSLEGNSTLNFRNYGYPLNPRNFR